jgi:hypothetical protein
MADRGGVGGGWRWRKGAAEVVQGLVAIRYRALIAQAVNDSRERGLVVPVSFSFF